MSDQNLVPSGDSLRAQLQAAQLRCEQLELQLAAARAGMDDLASAVSHDLRANLRHITAYAELVREELGESPKPEVLSYLDTVTRAAQRMGQQMNGLMALAQIGRAQLNLAVLDLRALIDEARQALLAEQAGRSVEWRLADDFPPVQGDAVLLRQLWMHLLSNALKFTALRSPARIELGWEVATDASHCVLFVRDNGAGFNPRLQDRLFRPFQRLHGTGPFEGLGLGLAQAKKIVQRHGGCIEAASEVDAGCQVRFTLPLPRDGAAAAA